jgi:nitrate/nitrite transporter NarK
MSDDISVIRGGIKRFRTGGIVITVLPLVLGVALLLAKERVPALVMLMVAVILLFLILWATHCAEEIVGKLEAERQGRG